jgi:hypothetical protein
MNHLFASVVGLLAVTITVGCGGGDPLPGNTWVSSTIPPPQAEMVTAFHESLMFGVSTSHTDTSSTGVATLSFDISNSATAPKPGCTETWAFSGCTYSTDTSGASPTFALHGCVGAVARSACALPTDNQSSTPDATFDANVNGGSETFTVAQNAATATGNSGVPWSNQTYTFYRNSGMR